MLAHSLQYIARVIFKNPSVSESFYSKKCLKILRNPWTLRGALAFLVVFYVGIPICFYLCPWVRRGAVFLHFADWPFQNLSSPEYYGLRNARHFFVETKAGSILGVWHIPPEYIPSSRNSPLFMHDSQPVVLYLHGSAESRSAAYRRSMYKVLTNPPINAHVLTFDYRGFGDSTFISPTVKSIEEDATAMFNWLQQRVSLSRIILWGHSMGSGIALRIGENLAQQNASNPLAIVLEAPFTSVADAAHTFPLSIFHRHLPLFKTFCSDRTRHPDTHMDSEEVIERVTAPLLLFHAEDDSMVWSDQGKRLWKRALERRPPQLHVPVFVELDKKYSCGHRNIHRALNLPFEVTKFLKSVKQYEQTR